MWHPHREFLADPLQRVSGLFQPGEAATWSGVLLADERPLDDVEWVVAVGELVGSVIDAGGAPAPRGREAS